ncbi:MULTISPECIES: multidrug transporter [unclassified Microbacterium]|uniref:multidrug transporter n=1 Tax=unclassified Microbacterium TaxID=2609290 RepID=UPI003426FABD
MTTHAEGDRRDDPTDDMTFDEKRHDQLTTAPKATEADAAPRIAVTEHDGNTRIDIAPDAAVRPGPGPGVELDDDGQPV